MTVDTIKRAPLSPVFGESAPLLQFAGDQELPEVPAPQATLVVNQYANSKAILDVPFASKIGADVRSSYVKRLREGTVHLSQIPESLWADKQFVIQAARIQAKTVRFVNPILIKDHGFLRDLISTNPAVADHLYQWLWFKQGSLDVQRGIPLLSKDFLTQQHFIYLDFDRTSLRNKEKFSYSLDKQPDFFSAAARHDPLLLDELENQKPGTKEKLFNKDPTLRFLYNRLQQQLKIAKIEHAERIPGGTALHAILRNRLDPDPEDDRPVAVVISPRVDSNGAFRDNANNLHRLSRAYRVMYYEVETDTDVVAAVKNAHQLGPIELLVLGGHGSRDQINLGANIVPLWLNEKYYFDNGDIDEMAQIRRHLAPGAHIVTDSCLGGEGRERADNLANALHKAFPEQHIWAATISTNNNFIFDENGKFIEPGYTALDPQTQKPKRESTPEERAMTTYHIAPNS